ncbi:MAG: hypothetical protein JWO43_241 [Candidatus Adlerbacteria bacterium]|nr:hypothetical protein [Candidatus Adlerbacteria bacterium]
MSAHKTIALVDIENASVGVALAHLEHKQQPRILAEKRVHFPVSFSVHSDGLLSQIEKSVQSGLVHLGEVAARLRGKEKTAHMGVISDTIVFVGNPWTDTHVMQPGKHSAGAHIALTDKVRPIVASIFDTRPTFHTFTTAARFLTSGPKPEDAYLLCTITGEVTELTLLDNRGVLGTATFPTGYRTSVRTLMTHAGLSSAEAHSALRLQPSHMSDATNAASEHFAQAFYAAAQPLMQAAPARSIVVVAQEPHGEWFAKALARSSQVSGLFTEPGVVSAAKASHFTPYVAGHSPKPDLFLMLEALFVDNRYSV